MDPHLWLIALGTGVFLFSSKLPATDWVGMVLGICGINQVQEYRKASVGGSDVSDIGQGE